VVYRESAVSLGEQTRRLLRRLRSTVAEYDEYRAWLDSQPGEPNVEQLKAFIFRTDKMARLIKGILEDLDHGQTST
jgi:hypothetical protein